MDEVPLCPAAAIQRGPRTVAILKSSTSQKPMVLRSWDLESTGGTRMGMHSPGIAEGGFSGLGNHKWVRLVNGIVEGCGFPPLCQNSAQEWGTGLLLHPHVEVGRGLQFDLAAFNLLSRDK